MGKQWTQLQSSSNTKTPRTQKKGMATGEVDGLSEEGHGKRRERALWKERTNRVTQQSLNSDRDQRHKQQHNHNSVNQRLFHMCGK